MRVVEVEAKRLIAIGDFHIGAAACAEKELEHAIENIMKLSDAKVIIMGDLCEFATRHSIGNLFDQVLDPTSQYLEARYLLGRLRRKIVGILSGNHEGRVAYESGLSVPRLLADELHVPYLGGRALIKWKVGGMTYTFLVTHGSGAATTLSGRINAAERALRVAPDADGILYGHFHELNYVRLPVFRSGRVTARYIIFTGSFLSGAEYANARNYPPAVVGYPILTANRHGLYITERILNIGYDHEANLLPGQERQEANKQAAEW